MTHRIKHPNIVKQIFIVLILISNISCSTSEKLNNSNKIVYAKIDQYAFNEIRDYSENKNESAYTVYHKEECINHSTKMFGRFASEADLRYAEILYLLIDADIDNKDFPIKNLSDKKYLSPYIFNDNQKPKITIALDTISEWFAYDKVKSNPKYLLLKTDTLLLPFKLSLINGYVKSEKTFRNYGRVKEMNIYLNDEFKAKIQLLDIPDVQEFEVDFIFRKNDIITLEPISFYKGDMYHKVCISEIQSNLGKTAHKSIDYNYVIQGNSCFIDDISDRVNNSYLGYDIKIEEKVGEKYTLKAYYKNGRLASKVTYIGKDFNGEHLFNVLYYVDENAHKLDPGTIKDGNGILNEYSPQGKLVKRILFKDGEIAQILMPKSIK